MVLTERIIHLLRDEHYSISEMIVLTFTELAAKEMKDRIIKKLSAENDPVLQEELAHIDEADIETFDSFCHKIVVKYSLYSNISSSFNIIYDKLLRYSILILLDSFKYISSIIIIYIFYFIYNHNFYICMVKTSHKQNNFY